MTQFEFVHLGNTHLERLQSIREEMERTIELHHQIDNRQTMSLRDYWRVSERATTDAAECVEHKEGPG